MVGWLRVTRLRYGWPVVKAAAALVAACLRWWAWRLVVACDDLADGRTRRGQYRPVDPNPVIGHTLERVEAGEAVDVVLTDDGVDLVMRQVFPE